MIKTKRTLLSAILFVLGAMLVCFGALAMPTKQTFAAEPAGQTSTTQNTDGSTELNAGEGVAYLHPNWKGKIVINGGTAGDLGTVTSITFNYQADLSGITGYNVGATSVTDTSTTKQSTIIVSVNGTDITIYSSQPTVAFPENSYGLFSVYDYVDGEYISNLQTISWGDTDAGTNVTIDTSSVTNMGAMFYNCTYLTSVDVSNWNTEKVTVMGNMFAECLALSTLDVSGFDTSSVTSMGSMFYNCSTLSSLDVSKWDTSSVTSMRDMFYGCSALSTLDVSNWNTEKVTNMHYMFAGCSSLSTLDVSKWNTSSVTDMKILFFGCINLTSLNLSNWHVSNVTDMSGIFGYSNMLTESGKVSTVYLAREVNLMAGTNFTGLEEHFYSEAFDAFMGGETGYTDEQAKAAIEQQYNFETEQAEPATMKLKTLNLRGWTISSTATTTDMFTGLTSLTTLIAPTSCEQTIALPVTLYDTEGNEYTSLSSATNGKILTSSLPAAGFDGAELVATTSIGVIALLSVGYALIASKKRKENKFNV